jgi:predicted transcriptional regulator
VTTQVVVLTSLDDTREHIDLTLRRRHQAVLSSFDIASLSSGDVTVLGDVSEANREAFTIVRDGGEVLVQDVASKLHITIEAAQLRLKELLQLRLISRTRVGKAYAYQLPRIETKELEMA